MKKPAVLLIALALLISGCAFPPTIAPTATVAPTAIPTATPEPSAPPTFTSPRPTEAPTATPSPTPKPSPSATPSPEPRPSPTATLVPPTKPAWKGPRPLVPWDDLSFYKKAMLPQFVGDVDWVEKNLHPTHYQLDLRLKWPSSIGGTEIVRYTNAENVPLDKVYFRLFPNLPGWASKTDVKGVWLDGRPVDWSLESSRTALEVPFARKLRPGQSVKIAIRFSVDIPPGEGTSYGVFGYKDGVLSLAHFYPMIPAFDSQGWHIEIPAPYGDLTYSDTSFYYVRLSADRSDLRLAASGKVLSHRVENGRSTWTIASGPMRDINLLLSQDFGTASKDVDGTRVTSYFRTGDSEGGKRVLEYASNALAYYSNSFGKYPFNELDVVESGTTAGGIEYPGLVVISDMYYSEVGGFLEFATAHEVGHQWWYSLVGNDQLNHPWLDEALTNYSTYLFERDTHGESVGKQVFKDFFQVPYESAGDKKGLPIGLPVKEYGDEGTYGKIVYGKGPLFFDELKKEVGEKVFFRILRTYFERYKYRTATPEDFLRIANSVSGRNLAPLFDRWGAR